MPDPTPEKPPAGGQKSTHAEREERILAFWKENAIFEKSLEKNKGKKEFIFYEGPPTANGRPGIHHLEARAFKDTMPRYKTMQGYYVRRKGGWDTHGLPVELQVEKELGLKSKKEIETYGIAAFNEKCKESVWKYVHEWEDFTNRMGYWIDLKNPYVTYKPHYIESLWNIVKTVDDKKLLYKDFKVVPWCPRCGTGLSSHELGQPDAYQMVKDLAVTVKFRARAREEGKGNTYILAWTTTPWTLPGNVALAIGEKIDYVKAKVGEDILILAKARVESVLKDQQYEIIGELKGNDLVGMEYEPLYPFMKDSFESKDTQAFKKAYKVYAADFVNTEDGTGIVHTAVMYGQDDFELGTKIGLPKFHLVNDDASFKKEAGFLAGKQVRDEATAVDIIKDLAGRGLLFKKEKHEHSYPHCWRCKTALIYYARDSWYIKMSSLRNELVKENKKINWEPDYFKEGRFGEWLSEVKDWAISRERYWGTPLPVWVCSKCEHRKVVGSIEEIMQKPKNEYWVMRHGESENNVEDILSGDLKGEYHLTQKGRVQVEKASDNFKNSKPDFVFVSPLIRAQETATILAEKLQIPADRVITDDRLHELRFGTWEGKTGDEFVQAFPFHSRWEKMPDEGEKYGEVKTRMGDFLYDIESRYDGKKVLIVTHAGPAAMLIAAARGLGPKGSLHVEDTEYLDNAQIATVDFKIVPHDKEYEIDLHRPHIDEVKLSCEKCDGTMNRVKEVMDVWFDSGAMPFAQDHYPFENKKEIDGGFLGKGAKYPADFISEAIDQTRGWFYTLHAIGVLTGKGHAYKNVVCLGHILDAEGKKMSKSLGNVIDPWTTMDKFGADAVRYWMYSVNQPGESKNFEEKTVDEVIKKVFNLTLNVLAFYKMYADGARTREEGKESQNALDQWIVSRLNQLNATVTSSLDNYKFFEPTRAIRDFVADLSQWYLRRSRDRFKDEGVDRESALATTRTVLLELSKLLAPFTPFLAEHIYQEIGGEKESVHLEDWVAAGSIDADLIADMESVREIASRGLEARSTAKINVRQPLSTLKVKDGRWTLKQKSRGRELLEIIKDEVNVKAVTFVKDLPTDVEIDTNITPELKEEGDLRELIRKIQDMRKEKGLKVGDKATLIVGPDVKEIVSKNEEQLKKVTGLTAIEFGTELNLRV